MPFELTEEQRMVRDMARDFAEKEVAPLAHELDEQERFPSETIPKLTELGFLSMMVPEAYGGLEADTLSYVLAVEEISRACASTGVVISVHNSLCAYPLSKFGSDTAKAKYLPQLAEGKLGSYCLTEPQAGSDAANQQTTATLDGDHYVLNGTKIYVTGGEQCSFMMVMAMTDKSKGTHGISAFFVEKAFEGIKLGTKEKKMGLKGSDTMELIFDNVRVPKENLLGEEGMGFKIAMITLDCGRLGIGAQALGIAQAAMEEAIKYAKERVQFGKPISEFQAIQWMIADMATEIEAGRALLYRAADLKDRGEPFSKEAAMAKLFCSEMCGRVVDKAVQIHGGYGYMRDYTVERLYRDARITRIYEGTSEIQRLVISRHMLRS
ncbi:MAG: acyl-CoA dehydrogenase [Gemmatimonadetes bacterium]|nr:MAG: acyl-CoA dehydrogenase [Gemmatimonadota bacterium]